MKRRNLIILILSIIAVYLFSSCRSNSELIKRRYSKGYYVAHTLNNPTKPEISRHVKQPEKRTANQLALPNKASEWNSSSFFEPVEKESQTAMLSWPAKNTDLPAKKTHATKLNKNFHLINPMQKAVAATKHAITPAPADRDSALSLLWIVIVIILIVWLIGFLMDGFGLGGLINILLVIALVLLVLWLLRVL